MHLPPFILHLLHTTGLLKRKKKSTDPEDAKTLEESLAVEGAFVTLSLQSLATMERICTIYEPLLSPFSKDDLKSSRKTLTEASRELSYLAGLVKQKGETPKLKTQFLKIVALYTGTINLVTRVFGDFNQSGYLQEEGETGVVVKKATTNPIANGGQADIYLGLLYSGTKVPTLAVVMKRLRVHRGADMKTCQRRADREALHWRDLKHEHIVPFFGAFESDKGKESKSPREVYLVSELSKLLETHSETGAKHAAKHRDRVPLIIHGTVEGLRYLASNGIIHGDLKGNNIIIFQYEERIIAKITDFGSSTWKSASLPEPSKATGIIGGLRWRAPEIASGMGELNEACDVWAFAMTVKELVVAALSSNADAVPFYDIAMTDEEFLYWYNDIRQDRERLQTKLQDYHHIFPESLRSLLLPCWNVEPGGRIERDEMLKSWGSIHKAVEEEWPGWNNTGKRIN